MSGSYGCATIRDKILPGEGRRRARPRAERTYYQYREVVLRAGGTPGVTFRQRHLAMCPW